MTTTVIKGGTLVDPSGSRSGDVIIRDGRIESVGPDLQADRVIDASGCIVSPGLVDLGAHSGEPGREEIETLESLANAAARGGFTTVTLLPDTDPIIDNVAQVRDVLVQAAGLPTNIVVSGALTKGCDGEQLAPMGEMAQAGVQMFTDADRSISDSRLMRRVLEYASSLSVTVSHWCQDADLARGGQMHEGEISSRLGIPGIAAEAEEIAVMRDIALARMCDARIHFRRVSTAGSLAMIVAARAGGLRISCDVTPHHLALTDGDVVGYDPNLKVSPPLRSGSDVDALRSAVMAGTIDAIATDHHAHDKTAKETTFEGAEFGTMGLETALGVALTHVGGDIDAVLSALSWGPAGILGLGHDVAIAEGHVADICVIDPSADWTVGDDGWASLSRNSAFAGAKLTGRVRHTICRGEAVLVDGQLTR